MRFLILISISVMAAGGIIHARTYGDITDVKFIRNYDGDTITAELGPPGSMPEIFRVIPVRIKGMDTPEINHVCKSKNRQARLREQAAAAREFVRVRLYSARRIDLIGLERGVYFRLIAHVMYDGHDLAAEVLAAGLAKPAGKKRPNWCRA